MRNVKYIAMDVHSKNIVIAESGIKGEAVLVGEYANSEAGIKQITKVFKKLGEKEELKICYEAGPCGFDVKRQLEKKGFNCEIVAPSLIPVQGGNRVKTDKRDAKKLARLYRAGELTMIHVPTEDQESVRDLVRCREDLVDDIRRYKQRIHHFLLRHGQQYRGAGRWTTAYRDWVAQVKLEQKELKSTLGYYLNNLSMLEIELKELDEEIVAVSKTESYAQKVKALCGYRGIGILTAMILLSEIVDFRRFRTASELMSYIGMVPCEYSSGSKVQKGSITKCGNARVRKALIESSWHYTKKPTLTKNMRVNLAQIEIPYREAPVKALKRLHKRFFHLVMGGKNKQKAIVATARELSGFVWHTLVMVENDLDQTRRKAA